MPYIPYRIYHCYCHISLTVYITVITLYPLPYISLYLPCVRVCSYTTTTTTAERLHRDYLLLERYRFDTILLYKFIIKISYNLAIGGYRRSCYYGCIMNCIFTPINISWAWRSHVFPTRIMGADLFIEIGRMPRGEMFTEYSDIKSRTVLTPNHFTHTHIYIYKLRIVM